ncbi:MAG: acylphosphatase [Cyclobacteriaceae bacterium]|nr:acylphosphatase [Cyclobacteriaceae bacterium SS2]
MIARTIHCVGKVQGVYFRATTKEIAVGLGLNGWVKNQADGSVMIHAEGKEETVNLLVDWCNQGPRHADVKSVKVTDSDIEGYQSFDIIR